MHATVDTGDDRKSKPKTVKFYNSPKFDVDVLDQMARKYIVNAVSHRWREQFFYNISDLAAINDHILYKLVTGSKISRRRYFLRLSEELCSKFVEERKANSHQFSQTNSSMQKSQKRKRCQSKSCTNKYVKHAAVSLSLFVVNASENRKNSFIVGFAANKY